jgi:predicted 2-oxoglutarate/Fe(II)-dependent dioxygenase YbiX
MPARLQEQTDLTLTNTTGITLGDPVPWFKARNISGGGEDLHVSAGRWILLAFLGSLAEAQAQTRLATLVKQAASFLDDHLIIYAVLATPPHNVEPLLAMSGPVLRFISDYDGAIGAYYGADETPRTIALDPMLRAIADIPCDHPDGHDAILERLLLDLPPVDNSAGVPLTAPALIVPSVFDFPLCELLVGLYKKVGGQDSGFLVDHGGKTATVRIHSQKRRQDMIVALPELRQRMRERIVTRLLPAIERYFSFQATRMDRYTVSCYDSEIGGYFRRHRDNLNAGAEHRRFAVSINLNSDYEGCDLIFPEFGRRTYRAPAGGAIVFSCGALHEVTPITKGARYAFLPFLYSEAEAKMRLENNARLHEGEAPYRADQDLLYPERPPERAG